MLAGLILVKTDDSKEGVAVEVNIFLNAFECTQHFFSFLVNTEPPMEKRGMPDGSGGETAAAQPTRGLGVSTPEMHQVGLERKKK